jgi:hypothetical protein
MSLPILDTKHFFKEIDELLIASVEADFTDGDILIDPDGHRYRYYQRDNEEDCVYIDDDECVIVTKIDGGKVVKVSEDLNVISSKVTDVVEKYAQRTATEGIIAYPCIVDATTIETYDLTKAFKHPNRGLDGVTVHDIMHPCTHLYPVEAYLGSDDDNDLVRNRFGKAAIDARHCWIPYKVVLSGPEPGPEPTVHTSLHIEPGCLQTDPELLTCMEGILINMLPGFTHVWSYLQSLTRPDSDDTFPLKYDRHVDTVLNMPPIEPCPLPVNLQFYLKIVDIEMKKGAMYEGVWHLEGMPQEQIVATGIYYLDSPINATLAFKRDYNKVEHNYLFSNIGQGISPTFHNILNDYLPLGSVQTQSKHVLCFPNSHVHKVQPFANNYEITVHRRFVVCFMVDPEKTLPDHSMVDPSKVVNILKDPKHHVILEDNMTDRMTYKGSMNARDVNFCEH